jgi:hypothetical protein
MTRVLIIQAASRTMNPLLDQAMIDAELADDRESASSEWLGAFRSSTTQMYPDDDIDRAIVPGRREMPFLPATAYTAFVDPSGGRHDSMTCGIAHRDRDEKVVLDRLLVQPAPFDPQDTTSRFCETIRGFGLHSVVGDRYASEWVSRMFSKYGVRYEPADSDKSAIYVDALPLFTQNRLELLDIPQLVVQLRLLERRPRAGGKGDLVDHAPRAFDDLANSAIGAALLASRLSFARVTRAGRPRQEYAIGVGD